MERIIKKIMEKTCRKEMVALFIIKKHAFTLAEVLITLAIIGVVAALTIPSVMTNYERNQTGIRLKKAYSTLSNTTNLAIKDYGPITGWTVKDLDGINEFATTYVIPYLNVSKICGNSKTGDCYYKKYGYTSSGSLEIFDNYDYQDRVYKFILNDGTFVYLKPNNTEDITAAMILFDVNGAKKPNIAGKDLFSFKYFVKDNTSDGKKREGRIIPSNIDISLGSLAKFYCKKGNESTPTNCAALIMKNNWKVPSKKEYVEMGGSEASYPF